MRFIIDEPPTLPAELKIGAVYLHALRDGPRFWVIMGVYGATAVCLGVSYKGDVMDCANIPISEMAAKRLVGICRDVRLWRLEIEWKDR